MYQIKFGRRDRVYNCCFFVLVTFTTPRAQVKYNVQRYSALKNKITKQGAPKKEISKFQEKKLN